MVITYRTGEEIIEKNRGDYNVYFRESSREEFVVRLDSIPHSFDELPFNFLVDFRISEESTYIKLLKTYGPEEESDLAIRFPGWTKNHDIQSEGNIRIETSLSQIQQFSLLWTDQLSEIKCQTYNVLRYLTEEYEKINCGAPPFPSPISIRSLKTSIFHNTILYIEAAANFLSEMAICINDQMDGSSPSINVIPLDDINKLSEAEGRHIKLEEKLVFSIACLNRLFDGDLKIDKGNHNWGKFKEFKRRRDSLTHVKLHKHDRYNTPTLDHMVASVKITDDDLLCSMELICWFNALLDQAVKLIGSQCFATDHNFNDQITGLLIELSAANANVSSRNILNKYGISLSQFH